MFILKEEKEATMKTEKQVSILGCVALLILVLTGCSESQKQTSAEQAQPDQADTVAPMAQAPETPQIFEGELLKVDATAQTLSIKSLGGQEMEFRYNDQTLIRGAEGRVEGLATRSGTPVSVYFDTATRTASKIEVRQNPK